MEHKPPIVKLDTMWVNDVDYGYSNYFICCGIWITKGVEVLENGTRIYTLYCVSTDNPKEVKIGDKRRLPEIQLLYVAHEVKITHLPKIDPEVLLNPEH